jgi:hypothetical protein
MSMSSMQDELNDESKADSPDSDGLLPPAAEEIKQRLESLNEQVTTFVKENAGLCLIGAVALGYVVARIARKAS